MSGFFGPTGRPTAGLLWKGKKMPALDDETANASKTTPRVTDSRACRAAHSAACAGHRSLSGAGWCEQRSHSGASHVPLFFVRTFQSHRRVCGRPQPQRRFGPVRVQTMADPPPGSLTWLQGITSPPLPAAPRLGRRSRHHRHGRRRNRPHVYRVGPCAMISHERPANSTPCDPFTTYMAARDPFSGM